MSKVFNIENWKRKEHFLFFKDFEEPFFGVTFNADVSDLYNRSKKEGFSFYSGYLFCALKAANEIMEFRLRLRPDDSLVLHDSIGASPTVHRPDNTFGFSYLDYHPDFLVFAEMAQKESEKTKKDHHLVPSSDDDTIHFTALPWIQFTSISHARSFGRRESIPKIAFGKFFDEGSKKLMPVSVHANHAVMDGYHVGLFAEKFQEYLNQKLVKKKTT